MEVAGHAVHGAVHRHRRDHDPVAKRHAAQAKGREHRRDRGPGRLAAGPPGEPALEALEPGLVAQAEILVADPLAAGKQAVGELLRRQLRVALDVLEPLGRVARRRLQLQDLDLALGLVGSRARPAAADRSAAPRWRASAIASSSASLVPEPIEKWAEWAASPIRTRLSLTQVRLATRGKLTQMRAAAGIAHIGEQTVAVEDAGEQPLAEANALVVRHAVEAGAPPDRLGRLDDEGRGALVEAIGVGLEPAPFGLFEREGEGRERPGRAEPDVAAVAALDLGPEVSSVAAAHAAVDAIGRDDQVGIGKRRGRRRPRSRTPAARPGARRAAAGSPTDADARCRRSRGRRS